MLADTYDLVAVGPLQNTCGFIDLQPIGLSHFNAKDNFAVTTMFESRRLAYEILVAN